MKVKMILPALTEAISSYWRPIKYSLFPPLGLATLAGYLDEDDDVEIQDEHVERLTLDDSPDLVAIEVYITSANRAYKIADHYRKKGVHVALGGLHVTALPEEASLYADTIFMGPGEDTWPRFLEDFRAGAPRKVYRSTVRSLVDIPPVRRDLIKRRLYLVPNSIVVSRGCRHHCDFCYKTSFFRGGRSFYTQTVDAAMSEIERLPGRHLFFLDDNIFADESFASDLFDRMSGCGRIWQAAGTIQAILKPGLLEKAVKSGLRSLFVGFETLNNANLEQHGKRHNLADYDKAVSRLKDLGVLINGSFVFGMDGDDESVFGKTVEWAVRRGITTATFHILTPYPGTALYSRIASQGRLLHKNWELYDTRHAVYRPAKMTPEALEAGYWKSYKEFYSWSSILTGAGTEENLSEFIRHVAYAAGWKKCEPLWKWLVNAKQVTRMLPLLETLLKGPRREASRDANREINENVAEYRVSTRKARMTDLREV